MARLILRPRRSDPGYGFRVIGLTAVLTVLFGAALESFAAATQQQWLRTPAESGFAGLGRLLPNAVAWFIITLLMLALATPSLLDKRARAVDFADRHPLAVWLLCMMLFAAGAASHGPWLPAAYCGIAGVAVASLAIRGRR